MTTNNVNRLAEMEVFIRVVELGGMSAAARERKQGPSAVSKVITRLESRLNVRLIDRSTRQLQLTDEGRIFFSSAVQVLRDVERAEQVGADDSVPSGSLRINTSAAFATHVLAPLVPAFLSAYPGISLSLDITDRTVDILHERTDVAIRTGPLKNSSLLARKIGEAPLVTVAAPEYLLHAGVPRSVADLASHTILDLNYSRATSAWHFLEEGKPAEVRVASRVQASESEALRHLALVGSGLARLPLFTVKADITAGRLRRVLPLIAEPGNEAFFAVYLGLGYMPSRTRVFIDYLTAHASLG
jgi:DNA-binding transcriptional LysR family regulator